MKDDSDCDGVHDAFDSCIPTPKVLGVWQNGCHCKESDNGVVLKDNKIKNIGSAEGVTSFADASFYNLGGDADVLIPDSCMNNTHLNDQYCTGDDHDNITIECANFCLNGKCSMFKASDVINQMCGCLIDGVCYQPGDKNPENNCLTCNVSVSAFSWSNCYHEGVMHVFYLGGVEGWWAWPEEILTPGCYTDGFETTQLPLSQDYYIGGTGVGTGPPEESGWSGSYICDKGRWVPGSGGMGIPSPPEMQFPQSKD